MAYPIDFSGGKILIFDPETKQLLHRGVVAEFDRTEVSVTVDGILMDPETYPRVFVLLLHEGDAYEFQGRVRKPHAAGRTEIGLLKGKRKEDRDAKRYRVNAPAQINCLVLDGKELPLQQPLGVFVENVSANGMLLRTIPGLLQIGTDFKLCIDIGGSNTTITSRVVRIEDAGSDRAEYGCRVLFVE